MILQNFINHLALTLSRAFQIGPAGTPAKHGIYLLDFFVVFAKNLTADRQALYFLCGYFLPQSTQSVTQRSAKPG
jgi:hypothetical protein